MNVSIIKHYDCHEIVNRLSTDCHAYPADCHHWALRFRVSWFKSGHFSRSSFQFRPCRPMAPMRPMIAPWSPHDRPMIAPWSPVHLQVATVKNAKTICTCKNFSIFRKSRKMCKKWWKMTIFSNFFLNKSMFSKVVF